MNAASPGDIAALPRALAPLVAARRWLVWRWETTDRGKRTKVPYRAANPSAKASSTDPASWSGYEAARDVVLAGHADGIGYALHGGDLGAFDLDDAIGEDGRPLTWAWDLIDECDSYVERTIGGNGLRILGTVAGGKVHRKQKVPGTASSLETYRVAERYIVVTGAALDGFGGELRGIDAPIDRWVARLDEAAQAEKERVRAEKAAERARAEADRPRTSSFGSAFGLSQTGDLPAELDRLIRYGAEEGQRSTQFMHVVGWLKDRGLGTGEIEGLLAAHPDGIAAKYVGRLRAEVDRAYDKAETRHGATGGSTSGDGFAEADGFGPKAEELSPKREPSVLFYGDRPPEPPPWLIREILPQAQVAILAGQHSAGKTFIGIDISMSTMTALPFIDHAVERHGAVLWLAAEGAGEVTIRLKAAAVHRLGREAVGELPFAYQVADVPMLLSADALPKLMRLVDDTKAGLAERFPGVELALIVLDTLNSAAGFQDENSASEAQKVFNVLRQLSNVAGALVLVIDHYGKMTETGVRGSSAKAGAADAILAALADKDEVTGKVSNRRMAVTKLRGAATGNVVPFSLKPVPVDPFGNTHCGVEWDTTADPGTTASQKPERSPWTTAAERTLKGCLERVLLDHGSDQQPYGRSGPKVRAAHLTKVRDAFMSEYAVDVDDRSKALDAKRNAFKRAREGAQRKGLVQTKEIGASLVDWIWLVREGEMDEAEDRTSTPDGPDADGDF